MSIPPISYQFKAVSSRFKYPLYTSLVLALVLPFSAYAWVPQNVVANPGSCGTGTINVSWDALTYTGDYLMQNISTAAFVTGQQTPLSTTFNLPNPITPGTYEVELQILDSSYNPIYWNGNVKTVTVTTGQTVTSISANTSANPGNTGTDYVYFSLVNDPSNPVASVIKYGILDNGTLVSAGGSGNSYSATGLTPNSSHAYTVVSVFSNEATSSASAPTNPTPTTAPAACALPDLTVAGTGGLAPSTAVTGSATNLSATVTNSGNATASNFPNIFQIATDSGFSNTLARVSAGTIVSLAGSGATSPVSGSYTFASTGTYYVRVCANTDTTGATVISESNTNNNCGNPQAITISAPPPSCTLNVSKTDISAGDSDTLTWVCQHASSCTELANTDGFSTGGAISGSDSSVTPTPSANGTATYDMTCDGQPIPPFPTITIHSPTVSITASPTRVVVGNNTKVKWTSNDTSSCAVTKNGVTWPTGHSTDLNNAGVSDTVTTQNTYVIKCHTTYGGDVTSSAIVDVGPAFQEF